MNSTTQTTQESLETYYDEHLDDLNSVCHEMTNLITAYAKRRPEMAALVCVGIGFVLGWKLKPW